MSDKGLINIYRQSEVVHTNVAAMFLGSQLSTQHPQGDWGCGSDTVQQELNKKNPPEGGRNAHKEEAKQKATPFRAPRGLVRDQTGT
jgi:hypothetical protein